MRPLTTLVCLAAAIALAACGKSEPAQPAEPAGGFAIPDSTPKAPGVSRPSEEQIAKLEGVLKNARELVDQARTFRREGEEIQRNDGRQAANGKLAKARKLYREASGMLEDAIEPELGSGFSPEQVDKFLNSYTRELGKWQKENAGMGKLHD